MRAVLCKHVRLLALGLCAAHCVNASGLPANFTVFPSEKAPVGAHNPSSLAHPCRAGPFLSSHEVRARHQSSHALKRPLAPVA